MVELQLHLYQNADHVLKNGSCCDNPGMASCSDHCDNYFIFWEGNNITTSPVYETEVYSIGDFIDFTSSQIPLVGGNSVSNPLNFTVDPSNWQVRNHNQYTGRLRLKFTFIHTGRVSSLYWGERFRWRGRSTGT